MTTDFEDQYLDVLQNIEWGLLSMVKTHPELCDHDMLRVIEYAIAYYKSKNKDVFLLECKLSPVLKEVFQGVSSMCNWRLGLYPLKLENELLTCDPISINELLACLKRVGKSIKFWTKLNGRKGYITFVTTHAFV